MLNHVSESPLDLCFLPKFHSVFLKMFGFQIVEIDAELWLPCLTTGRDDVVDTAIDLALNNSTQQGSFGKIFHVRASDQDCFLLKVRLFYKDCVFFCPKIWC